MQPKILLMASMMTAACHLNNDLDTVKQDASDNPRGADASTAPLAAASVPSTTPEKAVPRIPEPTNAAQSWTGYLQNYKFASGSDRVKLSFTSDGSGLVAGTVVFGNGGAPPPATDPDVAYPPGFDGRTNGYLEGYSFTMRNGRLESNRLRFTLDVVELWVGWCALQPPAVDGSHICIPEWTTHIEPNGICWQDNPSGQKAPVSCGKVTLCFDSRVCMCSTSGCVANFEEGGQPVSFDMFVANGIASGGMTGGLGDFNVYFTKDP